MKNTLLLLLLLQLSFFAFTQDSTKRCATPDIDTADLKNEPWYDNNDFLENFLDSLGYPAAAGGGARIVGQPQVRFWIPIKFWVYRNTSGTGGPTLQNLQTLMDDLNRRYNQANNTWIGFYMKCEPTYVDNGLTSVGVGLGTYLMGAFRDEGSINVHIFNNLGSNLDGFSIFLLNACMIASDAYLNDEDDSVLAHEIGHILGLVHTHLFAHWDLKCFTEPVSRTRNWPIFNFCPTRVLSNKVCEATGDLLRDTPADNDLSDNNSCDFNPNNNLNNPTDTWGDLYNNPPAGLQDRANVRNIMSYNVAADCVDQFSRLQIAVMLHYILFRKPFNVAGWFSSAYTFDDYEPDNESIIARNIVLNELQERNFHQQWNQLGGAGYSTQCDVDWVRFEAPCSGTFDILTTAMLGKTNVNTRMTIFDQSLTQIAQNDDISGGNLYSNIVQALTGGQVYFIRIENLSPNTTGYYTLRIVLQGADPSVFQITGASNICTNPESYMLTNLPVGASVSWTANPSNVVLINPLSGNPTTLTKQSNGNITLTATVSNFCGSTTADIVRTIKVGISPVTIYGPFDPALHAIVNPACLNHQYYFEKGDTETGQTYTWTLFPPPGSTEFPTLYSGSTVYMTFTEVGMYKVRVSKTNSCGTTFKDLKVPVQECFY